MAAFFYVYETVEFPVQLSDPDALKGYHKVIVSISQKDVQLDIDNAIIFEDEGKLIFRLEQEDTALFKKGKVDVQVNIYYTNGERDTTEKGMISVFDNLYKEVISP